MQVINHRSNQTSKIVIHKPMNLVRNRQFFNNVLNNIILSRQLKISDYRLSYNLMEYAAENHPFEILIRLLLQPNVVANTNTTTAIASVFTKKM